MLKPILNMHIANDTQHIKGPFKIIELLITCLLQTVKKNVQFVPVRDIKGAIINIFI